MKELDALVSDPQLYDDSVRAGKVVKERAKVESKLEAVKGLTSELQSWREMHGEESGRLWENRAVAAGRPHAARCHVNLPPNAPLYVVAGSCSSSLPPTVC